MFCQFRHLRTEFKIIFMSYRCETILTKNTINCYRGGGETSCRLSPSPIVHFIALYVNFYFPNNNIFDTNAFWIQLTALLLRSVAALQYRLLTNCI